jgi:hypothetical protein
MEPLSVERFAPLEGEAFLLDAEEAGALPLRLSQVREFGQPAYRGRKSFALLFDGPPQPVLPQRIYRLAHERLPELEIFLVPVAADASRVSYEAVFA